MTEKLVTTKDLIAKRQAESLADLRKALGKMTNKSIREGKAIGKPVSAFVDYGRWVAQCECNGAEIVDPDVPEFFCFSCGNESNGGRLRPVIFPNEIKEIEKQLLSVKDTAFRYWKADESMDKLKVRVEKINKDAK